MKDKIKTMPSDKPVPVKSQPFGMNDSVPFPSTVVDAVTKIPKTALYVLDDLITVPKVTEAQK